MFGRSLLVGGVLVAVTCGGVLQAGEITVRGSDSTLPVMKALAEAYQKETGNIVNVEGGGSGKGVKACLAGEVQMAYLSRGLLDTEKEAGLVGVPYALDGVAVIVHKDNPTTNLTLQELKDIFTGQTTSWSDGKSIVAFNRNAYSGTRECFQENVLKKAKFSEQIEIKHDTAILPTVAKIPTAIGYTSAGEVNDSIKVLAINGIVPSPKTLCDKTYPICRTLTLAAKGAPTPQVKAFMDYVLGPEGQAVVKEKHVLPIAE